MSRGNPVLTGAGLIRPTFMKELPMKQITSLLFAITLFTSPVLLAQDDDTIDETLEFFCEEAGGTWENGECK